MQFGYVPPRQALTENLLINPRGIINQASEPDGVIAAGDYFCDGWKAGSAGCEVYRIAGGGFDLRSGSIVQLIPNNLEASRLVRTNLDIVTGSPVIKVNGTANKAQAGAGSYIEIEISGDNSKFNRIVAADSKLKPIYQQLNDELPPCYRFLYVEDATKTHDTWITTAQYYAGGSHWGELEFPYEMASVPACVVVGNINVNNTVPTKKRISFEFTSPSVVISVIADARP